MIKLIRVCLYIIFSKLTGILCAQAGPRLLCRLVELRGTHVRDAHWAATFLGRLKRQSHDKVLCTKVKETVS